MRLASLALGFLLGLGPLGAPAMAADVRGTFVQRIANGAARLTTHPDGSGTLYVNLKGLRPGRWSERLYLGTCATLGRRVAVFPVLLIPATGSVARTNRLTSSQSAGRTLLLTLGSTTLCVTFGAALETGILAADAFDRLSPEGWGIAPAGGRYVSTAAGLSVDGAAALMRLGVPGANVLAELATTSARDVGVSFRVASDRLASGDRQYVYGEARRRGGGNAYRLGIRFGSDGAVYAQAGRVLGHAETAIGREARIPGVSHAPNSFIRVRGEVAGINPTRLRIRAWADGSPEPVSWAYVASDWTQPLQAAGRVGLRAFLPAAARNAPVIIRVDDLVVESIVSPPPSAPPESQVLVGAGDIAVCGSEADAATARIIRSTPGVVFTAGDNVYPNGTASEFRNCYEPAWGSFRSRTRPVPGNHDYNTPGATGYFGYFGAAAGDPSEGWYAYDLGAWRIYALNSNCGIVRCESGSPQEQWLRADLAANPRLCVAAIWHHPRFSSRGGHDNVAALWAALHDAGAELVISGHDHDYERFAPLSPSGQVDHVRGIRELIVGTGGVGLNSFGSTHPGSEVRNNSSHGVLRLTLHPWGYDWAFLPVDGRTFSDAGQTDCH